MAKITKVSCQIFATLSMSLAISQNLYKSPVKYFGYKKSRFRMVIILLTLITDIVILGIVAAGICYFIYLYNILPDPTPQAMMSLPESTRIFDRNGTLLYEVHGDIKRTRVSLSEIPENVRNATIAIEDKNFYKHFGFDLLAIIRALKVNMTTGQIKQGASTITQQLASTVFLNKEKSYARKIREVILAIKIERQYSKDEILEMYLNSIPYGSNAYGIAAASEIYFNKKPKDLNLGEAVYLAALPKAPTTYSPFGPNNEELNKRAALVLSKMRELGYIDNKEAEIKLDVKFKHNPTLINAPHFAFFVIDELNKIYGEEKIRQGGFNVYTSLDLNMQHEAESIISDLSKNNEKKWHANNAALVALDPRSGEILAMVGGRDFFKPGDGNVNVTISPRQPGSSFKPYIYAAAMENGLTPASLITDSKTDFASYNYGVSYIPRNYSGKHYGTISVRQALAGSLNVPAVKVLVNVGVNKAIDTAEKLGISTLKERERFGPALALGGGEVMLLEHTAGLAAFGNGGYKTELAPILKITDKENKTIYEHKESGTQAVSPKVAYMIANILSDNQARQFIFGSNNKLRIPGREVAVKTGTTQDYRDAWTVGFTPSLAIGVWVGNNDNSPMKKGADGSVVAAPIWNKYMTAVLNGKVAEKFKMPDGFDTKVLVAKTPIKKSTSTPAKTAEVAATTMPKMNILILPNNITITKDISDQIIKNSPEGAIIQTNEIKALIP